MFNNLKDELNIKELCLAIEKLYSIDCAGSECINCKEDGLCPKAYADNLMYGLTIINENIEKCFKHKKYNNLQK